MNKKQKFICWLVFIIMFGILLFPPEDGDMEDIDIFYKQDIGYKELKYQLFMVGFIGSAFYVLCGKNNN